MRIGREHAGHERRHNRARRLRAEAPRRERVHRFVLARRARGLQRLAQDVELAAPGQRIAAHEGERARGQRAQLPVEEDPAPSRRRRRLDDIDAELATQREPAVRRSAEKRARGVLAQKAVDVRAANHAARARRRLAHEDVVSRAHQHTRGREPSEPRADDANSHRQARATLSPTARAPRSPSRARAPGWSPATRRARG